MLDSLHNGSIADMVVGDAVHDGCTAIPCSGYVEVGGGSADASGLHDADS